MNKLYLIPGAVLLALAVSTNSCSRADAGTTSATACATDDLENPRPFPHSAPLHYPDLDKVRINDSIPSQEKGL